MGRQPYVQTQTAGGQHIPRAHNHGKPPIRPISDPKTAKSPTLVRVGNKMYRGSQSPPPSVGGGTQNELPRGKPGRRNPYNQSIPPKGFSPGRRVLAHQRAPNPLEAVEILCLNCMTMINGYYACKYIYIYIYIVEHSGTCYVEKSEVRMMDMCSPMQNLDYRINKLKEALEKHLQSANRDQHYISSLVSYCHALLGQNEYTKYAILKCREIISNIMV